MKRLFFLTLIFISGLISAKEFNNGTIKGSVVDEKNAALPFATVILKNASDSSLYKGEITNENGTFEFNGVKEGNYFIEVKMVGYDNFVVPRFSINEANSAIDLGKMKVSNSSKTLGEVTVAVEKPFIERMVDRTVVNIENSIVQTGSSVLEVMEKLPAVLVNQDGIISLRGKQGVIIMIDGKPTGLSPQDLANMLRGMSSSNIQKIEIITNPSAKYDASGSAGIINIIMKKNKREGLSGSINGGYGQGRYEKYNGGFTLAAKNKWVNVYMNYAYSHRKGFNNLVLTRNFYNADTLNTVFQTDNYIIFPFQTHAPRLGADFTLSKKTTVSVLGTSVLNFFDPSATNTTDILDGNKNKVAGYYFTNESHDKWYNYAGNGQVVHKFDSTGKELTVNLDYAHYWNNTNQRFVTTNKDANDAVVNENILIGDQKSNLTIYSAKADYSNPLKNNAKFETGLKTSYVSSNSDIKFYNDLPGLTLFDSTRSNHFLYDENINAAYINYNKELKKLNLQLGLRAEHTAAQGRQLISGQQFNRNYLQIFPSGFLDYKLNDNHSLNLSLGRRIDRPAYQQMNPFRKLIDATTYAEGNPYLLPQLSYNAEVTWSFKNTFFATFGYNLTTNNITDVLVQDGAKKVTVQTVLNLNQLNYYNVNLVFSKKLTGWWTTNSSILGYYGIYSGVVNNYTLNQGTPAFVINTNNSFSIMDGLSGELTFIYNYRNLYGVTMMNTTYNLTVGLQRSIFKKKGSITVNFTDIFWKAFPTGVTDFGNVNESWSARRDTRVVNVAFTYRFGKNQANRLRRKTGADDEKNRVGS
jgi:outer membrane receptor protein involved in Fe transport